jgi:uncharacterized protein YndB with AHSA1/START domain
MASGIALVARRRIKASANRVFAAWTQPDQLRAWWGPRPVTCEDASVDLRAGGPYRIVHRLPDGSRLTIRGEFRVVEPPRKLVYTWRMDDGSGEASLVTVRFESVGDETDVVVVHEEIPNESVRDSHERGWYGCLEGLGRHFGGDDSSGIEG